MISCALLALVFLPRVVDAQIADNNVTSIQVANNTTAVVIVTGNHWVVGLDGFNFSSATGVWIKVYDATTVTCGSGTPKARYFLKGNAAGADMTTSGAPVADRYISGIVVCVTTGYADSDTGAPAATTFSYNIHWR